MTLAPELRIPYAELVEAAKAPSGALVLEKLIGLLEDAWIDTYCSASRHSPAIVSFPDQGFTYLFDQASASCSDVDDRIVAAHGLSSATRHQRDSSRMQSFLGGRIEIPGKGTFDKGHVLAHAMGGGLDQNLFPQRPELNRGRSAAGRIYRRMERHAATHAGTFVFSRLIYGDGSWVPSLLEYGVLMDGGRLWVELFEN